jgi:hypothetical protein
MSAFVGVGIADRDLACKQFLPDDGKKCTYLPLLRTKTWIQAEGGCDLLNEGGATRLPARAGLVAQ